MADEILNPGESVEETVGEHIDSKAEIKSGASENIAGTFQDGKVESKKDDTHLLNKPNMTAIDKENMQKSITYLRTNGMDSEENLKKLDAINYGPDYIEIWGVKFSREKLVPQVKFNEEANEYNIFESNAEWVFKSIYNGKEEYYLTIYAYLEEVEIQGKEEITDDHMKIALQALPGDYDESRLYKWANILWNILNLSISGKVDDSGRLYNSDKYWYLTITTSRPPKIYFRWAFAFNESGGSSYGGYDAKYFARPCLYIVE